MSKDLFAFDAMPPLRNGTPMKPAGRGARVTFVMDAEPDDASAISPAVRVRAALKLLDGVLSDADMETLKGMCAGLAEDEEEAGPPSFPGKPNVGGKLDPLKAMDSRTRARVIDAVISGRESATKSFAEMFPRGADLAKVSR